MKKILIFLFIIFAVYNVKAYDFSSDPEANYYNFICVYASDNRGIGAQIYNYKTDNITRFRLTGNVAQKWTNPSGLSAIENDMQCKDELYYIYHQTSTEYFYSFNAPSYPSIDNGYKIGKLALLEMCWYDDEDGWDCDNTTAEFSSGDYYSSPNVDKFGNDEGEILPPSGNNNTKPNYSLGIFEYCDENGCSGTSECPTIFGRADDPDSIFGFMSKYIFTPIRWLTPIILIVLTSLDFAKAIFMDEKDGMGKAKSNFGKRAVAALIIFLAPTIVSILLTLIDGANVSQCMNNNEIGNL